MAEVSIATDLPVCQTPAVFHVGDVVKKLRAQRGWTLEQLAERANVNKGTLSGLERGDANFRRDTLDKLAKALGTTPEAMNAAVVATTSAHRDHRGNADPLDDDVSQYEREDIPVIQEGEASPTGLTWDADAKSLREVEDFTSRPSGYRERGAYAVVLRGDSMEPTLKRGMRLIVSPNIPVGDGDLAYAQLRSGERLIKIATKTSDGWLLTSANAAHGPRAVKLDEIEYLHRVAYVRLLK